MFLPYGEEHSNHSRIAWATWALIVANLLIFASISGAPNFRGTLHAYGLVPSHFRAEALFTSMFLHGSWLHVIGNMWFLHCFGNSVEQRCGGIAFLIAYVFCGVCGGLSHALIFPHAAVPGVGASGAIFGVMGMYLFLFPVTRIKMVYICFINIFPDLRIPAVLVIGAFFVFEALAGQQQALAGVAGGAGHFAHVGGFVAGLAIAGFFVLQGIVADNGRNLWMYLAGRVPMPPPDDEESRFKREWSKAKFWKKW